MNYGAHDISVIELTLDSIIFVVRLGEILPFSKARALATQVSNLQTVGIEEIYHLLGQQGVDARVTSVPFYQNFDLHTLRYPIN